MKTRSIVIAIAVVLVGASAWWVVLGPGAAPPIGACEPPATDDGAATDDGQLAQRLAWEAPSLIDPAGPPLATRLIDVTAFGRGFVAIGEQAGAAGPSAFSMRSTDGRTWDPPDLAGGAERWPETHLSAVTTIGERAFAIGSTSLDDRGRSRGAIWWTDDGAAWTEATGSFGDVFFSAIAGDPSVGIIAVGGHGEVNRAWWSADGETWEELERDLPVASADAIWADLGWADGQWVGAGLIGRSVDGPSAAVAWRSSDGRPWSCTVLDAGGRAVSAAHRLYRTAGGWLAAGIVADGCGWGASCGADSAAWISEDGVTWAPVPAGPTVGHALASGAEGAVALSIEDAWASEDGRAWHALDVVARLPFDGVVESIAVHPSGRIAAIGTGAGDGGEGSAWSAFANLDP